MYALCHVSFNLRPCHEAPTQQGRGLRVRNVQFEGQSTRLHEAFAICDRKVIIILARTRSICT